ncbi:hypothetical protein CLAFUW4_09877 [Fulvia fulva]|uniref:CENP-V/GFA domain-containing protein n=1 Tax=Passalora fulva TaxID=5499 RepID=A0A9Q8PHW6_PASFU|nr:uncharacterized protein CLAFUR5_12362 [Fulvia fulva]KAK4615310.1 hypothetical protein CLAFUR4_09882 [Fulvia fulva]KAK4616874.1 hypothetical protein CLAFUR0_09876 [Fulvia fulva]UJO22821.1 hypothetical protein CLAFUR5_12362 [Fulvia fulva]WPV18718.1 hypothetical protein CLAFUW4_09877 [Fulvia fulva]WPV33742.1 hypothetical protein CLAFUW7_09879 [Fulvia fulva]
MSPPPAPTTGHCLCNLVTYRISGSLAPNLACFCTNCQHSSGSAFSWLHGFMRAGVALEITSGQNVIKKYEDRDTESGGLVERWFCSCCRSPIIADTEKFTFVHGGTIDGEKVAPEFEFFEHDAPDFAPRFKSLAQYFESE